MSAQGDLFPSENVVKFPRPKRGLEVHEHNFIRGERANKTWRYKLSHSHEGGDIPHSHPDTGPSCYTIDKDDWLRTTGLRDGGRKVFTPEPTGDQFSYIPRDTSECEFEIHIGPNPPDFRGSGGGFYAASRMALAFGMKAKIIDDGSSPRPASRRQIDR